METETYPPVCHSRCRNNVFSCQVTYNSNSSFGRPYYICIRCSSRSRQNQYDHGLSGSYEIIIMKSMQSALQPQDHKSTKTQAGIYSSRPGMGGFWAYSFNFPIQLLLLFCYFKGRENVLESALILSPSIRRNLIVKKICLYIPGIS